MGEKPWYADLEMKDWLYDGNRMGPRWRDAWKALDWSTARMDMGPSPAGNPGPYWHVTDKDGDCTHRLYPKLLHNPAHLIIVRQAVEEARPLANPKGDRG